MNLLKVTFLVMVVGVEAVSAQEAPGYWGCLWVSEREPAQQFIFWCHIPTSDEGLIPCVSVPDGGVLDDSEIEPFIEVDFEKVDRFFQPRAGRCPVLPEDMPPIDVIRGDQ